VEKSSAFPGGIKYAYYFIGTGPDREILIGYDDRHRKGNQQHFRGVEPPVGVSGVSELARWFGREVSKHLQKYVIKVKGKS